MLSVSKLQKVILRRIAKTSAVFEMFPQSGKVIIGLSGGADGLVLVDMIYELSRRWNKKLEFMVVYVDAGFYEIDKNNMKKLQDFCQRRGMKFAVIEQHDIAEIIQSGKSRFTPCFICSRMRKKALFEFAQKVGAHTIALGHHMDDLIETFFLNIFHSRRISALMPNQSFFGGAFHIVRPMILTKECYIKRYASMRLFPVMGKNCPYAGNTEREWIKNFISQVEKQKPGTKRNILRAIFNPRYDYLWGNYRDFADKLLR